jgi:hypothetical protein
MNTKKELKEEIEAVKCVGEHDYIVQVLPISVSTGALDYVIVIKVCRLCGKVENEIIKQDNESVIHSPIRKI